MKIVIIGCGRVGSSLADQLYHEGHEISIIEHDEKILKKATEEMDVWGVLGNGANIHTQLEAGVDEADLILAVTMSDELNLLCCLIAQKVGHGHTIARVRNPEYYEAIDYVREEMGLAMLINPDKAAAEEILLLLDMPANVLVDPFVKGKIDLLLLDVPKGSVLDGKKIANIPDQMKPHLIICTVERGDDFLIPDGNYVLQANDKISVITDSTYMKEFFSTLGFVTRAAKNVMLIGGSRIAYYLIESLLKKRYHVKVVELDPSRCEDLDEAFPQAIVLNGDGTDTDLLSEEGLNQMDGIVNLISHDEENIILALHEKQNTNAKIFTKINRGVSERIVSQLDIGTIINPKLSAANQILRYVRAKENTLGNNLENLYQLLGNKAEALEFSIREESDIVGITLEKLPIRKNILVCSIYRNNEVIIPTGKDRIMLGDSVILVTKEHGLTDIRDIVER